MHANLSGYHCVTRFLPGIDTAAKYSDAGKAFVCVFSRLTGGTALAVSGTIKKDLLAFVQGGHPAPEVRQ
jgi:hypothetical protein